MEIRLKSQFSPKSVASSDFWNCFPYEVRKLLERRQESGRICCRELSDIVELDGDRKPPLYGGFQRQHIVRCVV